MLKTEHIDSIWDQVIDLEKQARAAEDVLRANFMSSVERWQKGMITCKELIEHLDVVNNKH